MEKSPSPAENSGSSVSSIQKVDAALTTSRIAEQNEINAATVDLSLSEELKDQKVEELAKEYGVDIKRLRWKIDLCVVPPFCLMYFLSFLDRVNISNAKIYGIEADLGLHGQQFNIALTVFFVPYIIFEVLSNYMLKIVKPHLWLSVMIFLFGIVTICLAYSHSFGGLVACRFLLGTFESGSFPAIFYIMSNFYTTMESQRRFSIFFSCTCLAGGCAGAIAYRLQDLQGVHGLNSWQWIYIVEGSVTAGLAILLFFIVPDFPEQARFLSEGERSFLKKKLEVFAGKSGFEIKQTWRDVAQVFKEPLMYIASLAYFCLIVPAYSYAYFAPTIIKELGYTAMTAQAYSIYPWLVSLGFSIILAFVSDKTRIRAPYAILASVIAIIGLAMVFAGGSHTHLKYGGCFLVATGLYSAMPILVCWMSLTFAGHIRKSVGTGYVIGYGNIGGIVSSFIFPNSEAPSYRKGLAICLGFSALSIIFILAFLANLMIYTRAKKTASYREKWDKLSNREKIMKGDYNPDYRYQY
ncbi:DEKNAAC101876 [Brettanomyces naardenensis]|uniref:DEKNAAC101876 n=1 Tax=Brettanomyces naardenensis TaxID=13370 RepID=A0A448YJ58_BRENA|nr:DEKNAAC101876 [Brettanomyces naardenensis]